jgi:hypothetical protein
MHTVELLGKNSRRPRGELAKELLEDVGKGRDQRGKGSKGYFTLSVSLFRFLVSLRPIQIGRRKTDEDASAQLISNCRRDDKRREKTNGSSNRSELFGSLPLLLLLDRVDRFSGGRWRGGSGDGGRFGGGGGFGRFGGFVVIGGRDDSSTGLGRGRGSLLDVGLLGYDASMVVLISFRTTRRRIEGKERETRTHDSETSGSLLLLLDVGGDGGFRRAWRCGFWLGIGRGSRRSSGSRGRVGSRGT